MQEGGTREERDVEDGGGEAKEKRLEGEGEIRVARGDRKKSKDNLQKIRFPNIASKLKSKDNIYILYQVTSPKLPSWTAWYPPIPLNYGQIKMEKKKNFWKAGYY